MVCITYFLRSVMARGPLYLVVNITAKALYASEQDAAVQFVVISFLSNQKRIQRLQNSINWGKKVVKN